MASNPIAAASLPGVSTIVRGMMESATIHASMPPREPVRAEARRPIGR